jgi:hypothetical protein
VDNAEIQKGTKMFLLPTKAKKIQTTGTQMEQRGLWEHLSRKENAGKKLEDLQDQIIQTGHTVTQQQEEKAIKRQLEERYKQEEILWRQKSWFQWLKEGEKNSKFFHRSMIHRRFIKHITKMEDEQGNTLLTHQEITHEMTDFYKDLLSEPLVDRTPAIERVTQNIPTLISLEQNTALMKPITQEEVDQSVQDLPKGKALGPDGFTTDFFHFCWPMLREEVWQLGGIMQLEQSSPNTKCHFSHLNPQRREGHKSEEILANSVMQCDL